MKILYIQKFHMSDFMADVVFHGLKSLYGDNVIDVYPQWYMYDNIEKHSLLHTFHGRGFTLCGNLKYTTTVDRTDIENKIKNRFFDIVVYGAVYRNLDYLDLVLKYYPKSKIVFVDGHEILDYNTSLTTKGLYFKMTAEDNIPNTFPIWLAIPKEKIYMGELNKNKLLGHNIPGIVQSLTFYSEDEYYKDYQESMFGYTWKKACWESLRHCEIIMNKCVPLFIDIKQCPNYSLTKLPKDLLLDVFNIFRGFDKSILDQTFQYNKLNGLDNFDFNMFDDLDIDFSRYFEINHKLHTYLLNNLTTEHVAKHIIETSDAQ